MKRFFFIFMLLVASCTKNTSYEVDRISSDNQKYNSSRLRFSDKNYKEMELEILFLSNNTKCFINFYRNIIKDEKDKLIKISTDDKDLEEVCLCMKGKQRLLLTERHTEIIIDSLKAGKKISIIHNKSTINIDGQEFAIAYKNAGKKKSLISSFLNTISR